MPSKKAFVIYSIYCNMDNGNQWELTVITTRIGGCVFSNKPYFLYYIIWLCTTEPGNGSKVSPLHRSPLALRTIKAAQRRLVSLVQVDRTQDGWLGTCP